MLQLAYLYREDYIHLFHVETWVDGVWDQGWHHLCRQQVMCQPKALVAKHVLVDTCKQQAILQNYSQVYAAAKITMNVSCNT